MAIDAHNRKNDDVGRFGTSQLLFWLSVVISNAHDNCHAAFQLNWGPWPSSGGEQMATGIRGADREERNPRNDCAHAAGSRWARIINLDFGMLYARGIVNCDGGLSLL